MSYKKTIYLDNAASAPIDKGVASEMARAAKLYGNPSSYNDFGRVARKYVEQARLRTARFLGARSDEVIFTASGTEANNLAIQGVARNFKEKSGKHKPHIITTQVEHPSVLKPAVMLENYGFDVTYLPVDREGLVNIDELVKAIRPETVLVSIMYANNEIGTIEPISEISKAIRNFRAKSLDKQQANYPLFHTDACQAAGYLDMDVNRLGVDLLTFNGSKIGGPRGIGVLYARRGTGLSPIIVGGEQESGLRAGTENTAAIGGLAVALGRIDRKESERVSGLRDYFFKKLKTLLPDAKINGPSFTEALKSKNSGEKRLPNNINISVPGLTSEVLLLELDKYGIYAGSGSACTSHSVEPSHVLKAIGLDMKYIDGALRFSMGRETTKKDMDYVLEVLPKIVVDLKRRYGKIEKI